MREAAGQAARHQPCEIGGGRTGTDAMLIGRAGPGLFIVTLGGAMMLAATLSALTPLVVKR